MRTVLILGSAANAVQARIFNRTQFNAIVAINNAWRIRDDWTHLVHAGDFPDNRKPVPSLGQTCLSHEAYVPANNAYGGIVYAGGTMAFSTAYWALHVLKPDLLVFCGCDMIYDQTNGPSHFYGPGTADPLRADPTLQSLEAKSNRILLLAAEQDCLCVNITELPHSRLTFPRITAAGLAATNHHSHAEGLHRIRRRQDKLSTERAKFLELSYEQFVPGGAYWAEPDTLNPQYLLEIDNHWLSGINRPGASAPQTLQAAPSSLLATGEAMVCSS
uniref:hypothetical protein n=1 Tax=Pararhizobium sp. IMCC3301 TaxID=3067904 RepID=UPI002741D6EC|nr:hypothetical protein [Pararhizobium sp. IMCC3301]